MSPKYFASILLPLLTTSCTLDLRGSYISNDAQNDSDTTMDDLIDTDNSDVPCTGDEQCDNMNPCDGQERCGGDGFCIDGTPLSDGDVCAPDPRSICLSGNCQVSICGDGYVDEVNGEQCDDANLIPGDGCENTCILTNECTSDDQCNDSRDCNTDRCDPDLHICIHPTLSNDVLCRPSAGQCDLEEYCDGLSPDCPPDQFSPPATTCNDGDHCTYPDICDNSKNCIGTTTPYLHGVIFMTEGINHTCALTNDGSIVCWGWNNNGQLGNGTFINSALPTDVSGISSGTIAISAGEIHTCAITSPSEVKCWGNNAFGQLGDGTLVSSPVPVIVSELGPGVVKISSGSAHTCALFSTGEIKCWGLNNYGQLGDGTNVMKLAPVSVLGLSSDISDISTGYYHTCALTETGEVYCWGRNNAGQLGDGTGLDSFSPIAVTGLASMAIALSTGWHHACVLLDTDVVQCWGYNAYGQLGDNTDVTRYTPITTLNTPSSISSISAGGVHTCITIDTDRVMCWGSNDYGEIGDGTIIARPTAVEVFGLTPGPIIISMNRNHTCAILGTGEVKCWGYNGYGQLGEGTLVDHTTPIGVLCE